MSYSGPSTPAAVRSESQQLIHLLDEAPLRLPQILAWALSSGGVLLDGLSVFMLGISIPLLTKDMGLDALQTGLLGAVLVAGAVAGASLGGHIADRAGRKSVFLIDMGLLSMSAALGAVAWNPWLVIGSQLFVGVGIGMDFPVGSSYVAECVPHRHRSLLMVATIAGQSVGLLAAAVIVLGLLRLDDSLHAWRLFFTCEAALAALFLIARLHLPESPRWLMSKGRNHEAVQAMDKLVPTDRHMLEELAGRLGDTVHHVARAPQQSRPLGFGVLFHADYRRRTLLSTLPWFFMDIATYGVGLFTAVLLAAMHFTGRSANLTAHVRTLAGGTGVIDLFLLLGFLAGLWAVARFGRIRMQLVGFAGMALGMGLLLVSTLLPDGAGVHFLLVVGGFVLFNLCMNMGPNSTTYILPTELFPTQVRATGAGFSAAFAKVGATVGVFLLPLMTADLGVPAVLALMAGVSLLGLLSTWTFRVEGHGLTLEQHHTEPLP